MRPPRSPVDWTLTGRLLALKCMSKRVIKGKNDSRAAMRERQHLQMVASTQSPFVVSLAYAFVDHDNVYVAMDLCAGGDLKYHLAHRPMMFREPAALRFYIP